MHISSLFSRMNRRITKQLPFTLFTLFFKSYQNLNYLLSCDADNYEKYSMHENLLVFFNIKIKKQKNKLILPK